MGAQQGNKVMFYVSAIIAIVGAIGYQYFVKRIPAALDPVVSVIGTYVAVLIIGIASLVIFPAQGGLLKHVRQLSWLQIALAVSIFLIELGFLLMYRYGWKLTTGNLVTGAIVNIALLGIGATLLHEKANFINLIGIVACIVGVALMGYRS
jgi:drug/metabolite transporter (DMT)-like permease